MTGSRPLGKALRDLIDIKDQAHYGLDNVKARRAATAVRRARVLIDAARAEIR